MHILLLGSGGREHALAWKIAASPLVTKLWCAPGNAGIAREAECVALDVANHAAVIDFCKTNAIELVVVGTESAVDFGRSASTFLHSLLGLSRHRFELAGSPRMRATFARLDRVNRVMGTLVPLTLRRVDTK